MAKIGHIRFIPLRIVDIDSNPVVDRTLSDWQVVFLRDNLPCTDPLTATHYGSGLYFISYSPSSVGEDYLDIYDVANDVRVVDVELIELDYGVLQISEITQDTSGAGALKGAVPNADTATLYLFDSQLWISGQASPYDATAWTSLDAQGNWLNTPLSVVPGIYHVVIFGANNEVYVIKPNLVIASTGTSSASGSSGSGDSITINGV